MKEVVKKMETKKKRTGLLLCFILLCVFFLNPGGYVLADPTGETEDTETSADSQYEGQIDELLEKYKEAQSDIGSLGDQFRETWEQKETESETEGPEQTDSEKAGISAYKKYMQDQINLYEEKINGYCNRLNLYKFTLQDGDPLPSDVGQELSDAEVDYQVLARKMGETEEALAQIANDTDGEALKVLVQEWSMEHPELVNPSETDHTENPSGADPTEEAGNTEDDSSQDSTEGNSATEATEENSATEGTEQNSAENSTEEPASRDKEKDNQKEENKKSASENGSFSGWIREHIVILMIIAGVLLVGFTVLIVLLARRRRKKKLQDPMNDAYEIRVGAKQPPIPGVPQNDRVASDYPVNTMTTQNDVNKICIRFELENGEVHMLMLEPGLDYVIGRGNECVLRLSDPMISKLHFQLRWNGESVYISDMNTANGTIVNGTKLRHARRIIPNDTIMAGNTRITVRW